MNVFPGLVGDSSALRRIWLVTVMILIFLPSNTLAYESSVSNIRVLFALQGPRSSRACTEVVVVLNAGARQAVTSQTS